MTLKARSEVILGLLILLVGVCHAQFTSNVQGIVQDPGANTFFGEARDLGIEENINLME